MNEGLVSVIIPTYKRTDFIERAIESVLQQTYKKFEIIVVDDNDQNSKERQDMIKKMKKYSNNKHIIYIKHEKNQNGAVARNTGIQVAKGEYITFLDDDDYFLPNRLEYMVRKMKEEDLIATYSSVIVIKNKKIQLIKFAEKQGNLQIDILKQKSFFGTGSNMFFKAAALKNIHGFDESFVRHQDLEIFVRFFELYEVSPVKDFLVVKNNDDRSNTLNIIKAIKCRKQFLDVYEDIIKKYNVKIVNDIYKANYMDLMKMSVRHKKLKYVKTVKQQMKKYNCKLSVMDKIILVMIYLDSILHLKKIKNKLEIHKKIKMINQFVFDYIFFIENKKY